MRHLYTEKHKTGLCISRKGTNLERNSDYSQYLSLDIELVSDLHVTSYTCGIFSKVSIFLTLERVLNVCPQKDVKINISKNDCN